MATVSGVTSSNASSIYGKKNVLTGLASGLDTESMIENAVSGIQKKISVFQQKQTTLQWKQEAYRSCIDLLVPFSRKYTSYSSSTNLLSSSFFNNAVKTTANGINAASVSATGRTNSEIQVNGVSKLATPSRYQVVGNSGVLINSMDVDGSRVIKGNTVTLSGETNVSNMTGSLTLSCGSEEVTLAFDDTLYEGEDFKSDINKQLDEIMITLTGGNSVKASTLINVNLDNGVLSFSSAVAENNVYISGATGTLNDTLGNPNYTSEAKVNSIDLNSISLQKTVSVDSQVFGASMAFTLNGISKSITLPTAEELANYTTNEGLSDADALTQIIQTKLNSAFGTSKITVSNEALDGNLQLSFKVDNTSTLAISSSIASVMGITNNTTYLDTARTLGDLLGTDLGGISGSAVMGEGTITAKDDGTYVDEAGNIVSATGERLNSNGDIMYAYDLVINGITIGSYSADTALETVMLDINKNTEAGVNVSYSKLTNQFVFTAQETGASHEIKISGELGEAIFGVYDSEGFTQGQDAVVNLTVNGSNLTITRSNNTFDIDGLSITVCETFNCDVDEFGNSNFTFVDENGMVNNSLITNAVTFTSGADTEKIVEAIKTMVADYNEILTSLWEAFNTRPTTKSNGSRYEPLTESDKAEMTETAITNYESEAKQGILFGDSDLTSLYNKLVSAISPGGSNGAVLRSIGINTSYSSGLTTISLDETALKKALNNNPDSVRDAFTKTTDNGLMQVIKTSLDTFASVDSARKGILVNKAGSAYSTASLLSNSLLNQIEAYDLQIEKWQEKLSNRVDYYTKQFTQLEQAISQLNSQSSIIASLMGN